MICESPLHRPVPPRFMRRQLAQPLLICFALAVFAMLPTQIFRLFQSDALPWLLADYGGRLLALGVLLILPAGRWVLSQPCGLKVGKIEALIWILGIVALFQLVDIDLWLAGFLPDTRLGAYPAPQGALYFFDLSIGLALVALHEEVVFRQVANHALSRFLASDLAVTLVSAAIFAAYHWWTGIGNMLMALLFGLIAMPCYRRCGSLWPVGIAHYFLDLWAFA